MILTHPGQDLQAVLSKAPPGATIRLEAGEYRAKAAVFTPGLTLVGAGADRTRIVWDDYAKKPDSKGVEYNTFRTCRWSTAPSVPRTRARRWPSPSTATGLPWSAAA